MSNIQAAFQAKENLEAVSTIIFMMAKNNFGVELDGNFSQTLFQIMNQVYNKFGRKPNNISDQDHLKNLNKLVIDDSLKYIGGNAAQYKHQQAGQQSAQFNQMFNQQFTQQNPQLNPQFQGGMAGGMQNMQNMQMHMSGVPGGQQNPFNQQMMSQMGGFGLGQTDPNDLTKLVDNLAYQRGYNRPQDQMMTPRVDFAMPVEPHGIDPNFVLEKLKQERNMPVPGQSNPALSGGGNAMNLNEILGTAPPQQLPQQMSNLLQQAGGQMPMQQAGGQMPMQQTGGQMPMQQTGGQGGGMQGTQGMQGGIQQFLNAPPVQRKPDVLDQMIDSQEKERQMRRQGRNRLPQNLEGGENTGDAGGQEGMEGQPGQQGDEADGNGGNGNASSEYYNRLQAIKNRYNPNGEPDTGYGGGQQQGYGTAGVQGQHTSTGSLTEAFLSLDLRQDLGDIDGSKYCLKFNEYPNVIKVELVSCMMTANEYLEQEPYIYFNIDEIDGNYQLSNQLKVFGKLFPEKRVGNFIEFRPEKCIKTFNNVQPFYQFTVSFRKFNQKPIPLHKLGIKKVIKQLATNQLKIITKTPHHLAMDEEINISTFEKNQTTVNNFQVLEVLDDRTFTIENLYEKISPNLSLERKDIKCSLTFKVYYYPIIYS